MDTHPSTVLREKVIDAVKRHRGIYDTKSKEYKLQHLREKAWTLAASEVPLSVSDTKLIFQTLRQTYSRKVRKMREASDGEESDWPFYKQMSFLYEFVKPRKIDRFSNIIMKKPKRQIRNIRTEYEDSNPSPQDSDANTTHDDPLDGGNNSFLRDAIIMDSDASDEVCDEKPIIMETPPSTYMPPNKPTVAWQHQPEELTPATVDTAQSSANPDVLTYYTKIIEDKLRALPAERAEDVALKFIVQLNAELKK